MNLETWGPPFVVLVLGLVGGGLVVAFSRGTGRKVSSREEDLLARKQALIEELRGLQAERGKVDDTAFEERWRRTLDRAAMTLRELETPEPDTAEVARQASPELPGMKGAAWAAAFLAFFAILGLTLTEAARPRGEGGSLTGATVDQRQAALEELQARLEKNPADVEAAAALAHAAIRSGDFDAGMRYVDAGRQVDPEDVRIKASLAALMIAIGMLDKAQQNLDDVQARDPELATGWLWRGVLELNRGDRAAAEEALTKAMALSKDAEDRRLAALLLADLKNPPAAAPTEAAPSTPAAEAGPARLSGTIRVESATALPPGAIAFVFVRPSAEGRGPPLAALRIPADSLPAPFSLGDGDILMQGSTWPEQVWISARIDTDGNAASREEGQPVAEAQGPFTTGQTVDLVLR